MSTDSDRYTRLHAILASARSLVDDELDEFLVRSCGADVALRAEVIELLAAGRDDQVDDLFADERVRAARLARDAGVEPDV